MDKPEKRFYIDCEFDGHSGPLLSIALVCEDGFGVHIEADAEASDEWVVANVVPLMDAHEADDCSRVAPNEVGGLIRWFLGETKHPVIIADSPVDIARFCQAISTGPDGEWASADYPRMSFEVHNVDCYPTDLPRAVQHNAWWDAMALRHKLISAPFTEAEPHRISAEDKDCGIAVEGLGTDEELVEQLAIRLAHHVIIGLLDRNGGGVIVEQLTKEFFDQVASAALSTHPAPTSDGQVTVPLVEEAIEAALHARVPGGSEVWVWLPQADAFTPSDTARDVIRCALEAAIPIIRASVEDEVRELREALKNPPKHNYWGAGEPDCPQDIKCGNGELHTLRCKVCGEDSPRNEICLAAIAGLADA